MASRVTRSFLTRRQASSLSLSSLHRFLSSSSSTPSTTLSRATRTATASEDAPKKLYDLSSRRYLGSSCGIGETMSSLKGQTYPLASFHSRFAYQLSEKCRMLQPARSFQRSFASSSASEPSRQKQTQDKKDISTVEDPFDSPTYHIPDKPVTFTEGASYSIAILFGLGVAALAAYGVFKELIFEPKEYKIFNKALGRIQNEGQVRVRIGSPITGYGQETRNRTARQKIPHRVWTDQDGVEHVEVNFRIRGPQGNGQVFCEMFKDNTDKQWKYMYLIVDILSPSRQQLMLESFLPA